MKDLEGNNLISDDYKEPLQEVQEGYGYYGVILTDESKEKIQCHICGKMFRMLGSHVWRKHQIRQKDYKEKFKLSPKNSLCSEKQRIVLIERTQKFFEKMTEEEKKEWKERAVNNLRLFHKNNGVTGYKALSLEARNKRGTCPDQLLDKLKEVQEKLGHSPSRGEFDKELGTRKYSNAIEFYFGSWNDFKEIHSYQAYEKNCNVFKRKYSNQQLSDLLRNFYDKNKRIPVTSDFKKGLLPDIQYYQNYFGSLTNARIQAGLLDKPPHSRYDKYHQELLKQFKGAKIEG